MRKLIAFIAVLLLVLLVSKAWTASNGTAAIAVGKAHTCALSAAGGVKCWGQNDYGQLGSNTTHSSPADVTGLTRDVAAIAAGDSHTCALTTAGGVKCWGRNGFGSLGDGTNTIRTTAVDVAGLASGVVAITAGDFHTCALTTRGGVRCWGDNSYGQLGNDATQYGITHYAPEDVTGLTSGVAAIAAGIMHTCALTTTGGVKCWGLNDYSQLGTYTTTDHSSTPLDVTGLSSGVTAIATGYSHTCALTTAGGAKCWGLNYSGQLGDTTTTAYRTTPVDVAGLTSGVVAIATGYTHTCALTAAGGVKCWGSNYYGQLGDNTTTNRLTPVATSGLSSGVAAIAAGLRHSCALTSLGGVQCWGLNDDGQLGDGTTTERHAPVDVSGLGNSDAAIPITFTSGWNLAGNGIDAALNVATVFGNANNIVSVWKWNAATGKWAFYTPGQADGGASLAASRGYDVLSSIEGGEGFWVNAKQAFGLTLPGAKLLRATGDRLKSGWNLIAIGENLTPRQYNAALGSDVTSLWAWEASQSKWYFYAPSLEGSNSLTSYVAGKGYLDFTTAGKTLEPGLGFWVYRPAALSVTDTENGRSLELSTRQLLEVRLAGNATTGYMWSFDDNSIDVLAREGESVYVLDSPVLAGSGGVSVWKFNAVKPGTGTLRFEYRRSRETLPAQVVLFPITVAEISGSTTASSTTTTSITTTTIFSTSTTTSTTTSIPTTSTTRASTTSSTATTTSTTTTTTAINAPPCNFMTTTKEWNFGAEGGDGWFSVQITFSPCLIRPWDATGTAAWISRIYTYGMSNGNGNVGLYVQPNDTGTGQIPDRQGNVRVSWNGGLSFVDFLVKQKGANQFRGTLFGTWSGICHYSVGDISGSGNLRMDIDINGGVTGTYAGDENGTITGSVDGGNGGLTTRGGVSTGGGSGGILWQGTFWKTGSTLKGSGTWTDSSGCSGDWGG